MSTELECLVELNENAKAILVDAKLVNLRALDAIVRAARASQRLRGFAQVSVQMQSWCRDLSTTVRQVFALSGKRIRLTTLVTKRRRELGLVERATSRMAGHVGDGIRRRIEDEHRERAQELLDVRQRLQFALQELEQLGLMAQVLSRAALIESSSGTADEWRDLTLVSREFAERAEAVTQRISAMMAAEARSES